MHQEIYFSMEHETILMSWSHFDRNGDKITAFGQLLVFCINGWFTVDCLLLDAGQCDNDCNAGTLKIRLTTAYKHHWSYDWYCRHDRLVSQQDIWWFLTIHTTSEWPAIPVIFYTTWLWVNLQRIPWNKCRIQY